MLKVGSWTSSIGITYELIRNAHSQVLPRPTECEWVVTAYTYTLNKLSSYSNAPGPLRTMDL